MPIFFRNNPRKLPIDALPMGRTEAPSQNDFFLHSNGSNVSGKYHAFTESLA
jgi:hypothetical protein